MVCTICTRRPRKRAFFCWSWRSAGPEGEGGCFDAPSLPPLDSLPSRNDQGGALDPNAEGRFGRLAEKALYCASDGLRIAFSGQFSFGASCGRNSRMRTGAALRFSQAGTAPRRENRLSARGGMSWSALPPCALPSCAPQGHLTLRWARGPGRVFRLPLPRPSGLPTLPQRPGRSPGPKSRKSLRASG